MTERTERIDGRPIAAALERELAVGAAALSRRGIVPGIAIVQFGADEASRVYTRSIEKACRRVGFDCFEHDLPATTSPAEAHARLDELNADPRVHGVLVKRPLPSHLDEDRLVQSIASRKDVDGATHNQLGKLVTSAPSTLAPCTPLAVIEVLHHAGIPIRGSHVAVIGRSATVGRPLAILLARKGELGDATVTLCHSETRDLASHTRRADIVVASIGRPRFIGREHVRPDATVIDVGINVLHDADGRIRIVGDADTDALEGHCRAITPVPGGIGPVTVTMLLRNTLAAATA